MAFLRPPRNRKDHYVPQGYLHGFVDPKKVGADRPLWCLNKARNRWERKSPKQICHLIGMYDFANDAVEAEHADVTFKVMEDRFPAIRNALIARQFQSWKDDSDFLFRYMQMIRVRSPQYFVEQGLTIPGLFVGRFLSVDETGKKITYDDSKPLTVGEVHDFTLTKMREEFQAGAAWMADFHWQIRTTFDTSDPVVTSPQPLFVKITEPHTERAMTMDLLVHPSSELYFPLCWQACLVGRSTPFDSESQAFERANLAEVRHMIAQLAPEYVISPQRIDSLKLEGRPSPTVLVRSRR